MKLEGHHVLVVDDDRGLCEMLTHTLSRRGARVTCVRGYPELLQALDVPRLERRAHRTGILWMNELPDGVAPIVRKDFTAILLDGNAQTSGADLIPAIRHCQARAAEGARVIAITASPHDRRVPVWLAAGALHLPKPFDVAELIEVLS